MKLSKKNLEEVIDAVRKLGKKDKIYEWQKQVDKLIDSLTIDYAYQNMNFFERRKFFKHYRACKDYIKERLEIKFDDYLSQQSSHHPQNFIPPK